MSTAITWIPVAEAAKILGVSTRRVYQLIDSGDLMARKCGTTWLVSQVSVFDRQKRLGQEALDYANTR